jgi:hypothetical protein
LNHFDADGREPAWQITPVQAWWDPNMRRMLNSPEYQKGFQMGMGQGLIMGAELTIGAGAAVLTDGAVAPLLADLGLGGRLLTIGRGVTAGVSGDFAIQTTRNITGEQNGYSGKEFAASAALGGTLSYGGAVVADFVNSFRTPLQQQLLEVGTSPQFLGRAQAQGFTADQISQLGPRIEQLGDGLTHTITGGYADATGLGVGRLTLLSSREGAISHELGHLLDDIANPGLFSRATQSGFGFSGFYNAESIAYTMQYGLNPAPLTAFNAGLQSHPYLTASILGGGILGTGYLLSDPLSDLIMPLFGDQNSGGTRGTLGKKPH